MPTRLPSLDALRFFEVTARHMSFTLAAEELFVSQSAVSQKVRHLEEQLGYPLFQRATRKLILTSKGAKLLPVVRRSLNDIGQELNALAVETENFKLRIHTPPSISTDWLIPRLADFNQRSRNIDLDIVVDHELPTLNEPDSDVGIVHLNEQTAQYKSQLLFKDYVYPVATRELIQECHLYNISDIKNAPLLHDSMLGGQLNADWDGWFSRRKLRNLGSGNSISLTQANMIVGAALAGQGIGLVRHCIAAPHVAEGKLIPLFNDIEENGGIYIIGSNKADSPKMNPFWKWAVKQGRQFSNQYAISKLKIFEAYNAKENKQIS